MEVCDPVTGRDQVHAFGIGCRTECNVQPGQQPPEGTRLRVCHLCEVNEVADRDDLQPTSDRAVWRPVPDEPALVTVDPAADGLGMQVAVRATPSRLRHSKPRLKLRYATARYIKLN